VKAQELRLPSLSWITGTSSEATCLVHKGSIFSGVREMRSMVMQKKRTKKGYSKLDSLSNAG
jgi:hypothetical protein